MYYEKPEMEISSMEFGGVVTASTEVIEEKEDKSFYSPSPLDVALCGIGPNAFGRIKTISKYIVKIYNRPYVDLGFMFSAVTIDTIVSKYIDNQLLFAEKYENHVIDLTGKVEQIGKDEHGTYIAIGDGKRYYRSGTSGDRSVAQRINCYLNKKSMEDNTYKNLVLNMRPGAEVTLVGVLSDYKYGYFELYGTEIIEVNGTVPERIMNIARNVIYKENQAEEPKIIISRRKIKGYTFNYYQLSNDRDSNSHKSQKSS